MLLSDFRCNPLLCESRGEVLRDSNHVDLPSQPELVLFLV